MRYLLLAALLLLVAFGAAYGVLHRKMAALADSQDAAKLEAVQKAREAVSGDLQGLRDQGARLRRDAEVQAAEVARLRGAAVQAGKTVAAVHAQGEKLKGAPADQILAECARQGYTCRMVR